jgi:hypothetical protein
MSIDVLHDLRETVVEIARQFTELAPVDPDAASSMSASTARGAIPCRKKVRQLKFMQPCPEGVGRSAKTAARPREG